jgi:hypothetical protein
MLASGRFCTAAIASVAMLAASASLAPAQVRVFNHFYPGIINPATGIAGNPMIAPGLTLQQYAYNVRTIGNAYSSFPPYMYGYNPYPSPIYTSGPIYPTYGGYGGYGNPYLSTGYSPYGGNPYMGNPYLTASPGYGGPSLSTVPGYGAGYDNSLSTNPYAYNPYYYNQDPSSQIINSVANLQTSTAQYYQGIQRARLLQEDVTRSRIETQRKQDEYARERRAHELTSEDIRQKEQEISLSRARRDPPLADVLSGKALNDLLVHLETQQSKGFRGNKVDLDEIDLSLINVANGAGNIGLVKNLKQGDKLAWPTVLLEKVYADPRDKLDARLLAAVNLLRIQKPVPPEDISDLEDSLKKMVDTLNASINDLSPTQYITAKRFLSQVQDAITAIKAPGAVNYFNGQWVAKGKKVAELVDYMKAQGLSFAPATPGGEGAYRALHQGLVAYDANMTFISAPK